MDALDFDSLVRLQQEPSRVQRLQEDKGALMDTVAFVRGSSRTPKVAAPWRRV